MPRSFDRFSIRGPLALALCLLGLALSASPGAASDPRGVAPASPNPLEGLQFFVDQESPAWQQWEAYRRTGQPGKANLIWKIAGQPRGLWLGTFTRPRFAFKVRRLIDAARAQGTVPIFTVLRAEATGCGPGYTGGGPAEDARTRQWYDRLARVIGDDRVVIAFEPDSLGTLDCQIPSRRDDRLRVLAHGVAALSRLPNATIYLEAGASDWEAAARTAKQL
ncbi:MAG TPA: glycoside hydrolase family 6 protein, partial [Thermoleophilaceae bacterium]|nr:glycoside hydrolase family 6 protein [Thermoleophilaceae bacterium]